MRGSGSARRLSVAVLAAMLGGLGGCWAQPGFGPLHQGSNPFEDELTTANVATLDVAWTARVDTGPVRSDPVVSGAGLVHVSDDRAAYGLAQSDGARRWRRQVVPTGRPAAAVASSVSTSSARLHVGWGGIPDDGGRLVLDASSGTVVSSTGGIGVEAFTLRDPYVVNAGGVAALAGAPVRAPAVAGGVVYVASAGGAIEAFSAAAPGPALFTDDLGAEITGGPTIAAARLLVGTAGGRVVAYTADPASG